tara:strand:- start:5032 stop:5361 length:330 start_codon:yes stop_codon:yes gene_type:complete
MEEDNKISKIYSLIPMSFIHKYNNLCIKRELSSYFKIIHQEIYFSDIFFSDLVPTKLEKIELKINYIKRLQVRYKYVKMILKKIIYCEDLHRIILNYLGLETLTDLFKI